MNNIDLINQFALKFFNDAKENISPYESDVVNTVLSFELAITYNYLNKTEQMADFSEYLQELKLDGILKK